MKKPVARSPQPAATQIWLLRFFSTSYQLPATSCSRGFTLVELLVAVGLFAIVMTVATGALLSLVVANRKAQALQAVVNNLNIAVDGMVRTARMGTVYHCGAAGAGAPLSPADCPNGSTVFAFEPYGKTSNDPPVIYSYDAATKRLYRAEGGGTPLPITAPEVQISDVTFYVVGTARGSSDALNQQPKVVVVIKGNAGSNAKEYTTFHVQATAVQRQLDI
jgi:prepilin-type N-terminal cleavage/methylation domain-containing protein